MSFCGQCGSQIPQGMKFCGNCGAPTSVEMVPQQPQPIMQQPAYQQSNVLCCPNCHGTNVSVQLVEVGQQTTKKGVGFGGHVNNAARMTTAVMTLGVSNLVWKKSRGTNKTKTINATMGVCQTCGCTFEVQQGNFGSAPGSVIR